MCLGFVGALAVFTEAISGRFYLAIGIVIWRWRKMTSGIPDLLDHPRTLCFIRLLYGTARSPILQPMQSVRQTADFMARSTIEMLWSVHSPICYDMRIRSADVYAVGLAISEANYKMFSILRYGELVSESTHATVAP